MKYLPRVEHFHWPIQIKIKYALFVTLINAHKSLPGASSLNGCRLSQKERIMYLDLIGPACSFHPETMSGFDITALPSSQHQARFCPALNPGSQGSLAPLKFCPPAPTTNPRGPSGHRSVPTSWAAFLATAPVTHVTTTCRRMPSLAANGCPGMLEPGDLWSQRQQGFQDI